MGFQLATEQHIVHLIFEDVEGTIREDINKVIQHRLDILVQKGSCRPLIRDALEKALGKNADRTFLWVDLVLRYLERQGLISPNDISGISSFIPPDLSSIYEQLLSTIQKKDNLLSLSLPDP